MNIFKSLAALALTFALTACNPGGDGAKYIGTWQRTDDVNQKWEITHNRDDIYLVKSWNDKRQKKFIQEFTARLDKETLYVNAGISPVPIEILEDGRLAYYGKTFTKLTGGGFDK